MMYCCCSNCARFGPTPQEEARRNQKALDIQIAMFRQWSESPEGQATIERNLRKIGWKPKEEMNRNE